ncbi:metallopeptidase TldD-related protein [Fulvivirga ulvae]|uniref:metallopeptidase TldD-related protein n=1 Tax=Fulvivirga ulvae TaxID=2904245 RepID=UPI001F1A321C|nr:metallopeptidase TldD-related protein [Fulvivirga ulvae]UII32306.1 metallopeptidase TldD-related protein [Fulvivirga ulvae]
MKKYCLSLLISAICFCNLSAQQIDTIKQAMKDELTRSINELSHAEYEKPFYIGYTIEDTQRITIQASLGGILNSNKEHYRSLNTRVLVGDYDFNDESLQQSTVEPYYTLADMNIPVENDYYGIRRSLWSVTDKVYKTAGEVFEEHKKNRTKEEGKSEKTPLLKFYKHEPVRIHSTSTVEPIDKELLENEMRKISSLFLDYPDMSVSNVVFNGAKGATYFMNTEGSDVYMETNIASLIISAAFQNEDGSYVFDQYRYINEDASKIFKETDFRKEVADIYKDLSAQKSAKQFEDSYEGPVIFIDDAVPHLFGHIINQFRPEPPGSEDDGYNFVPQFSLESKLNKKIFSESLSITLTPSMTMYNDQPLPGSYLIDDEGVVPHEKIVLVEDGIVNNLMVGRNYYKKDLTPNGTGSGPGVVHINISQKEKNLKSLKKKMLKIAEKEGLKYGLMISKINNEQLKVYKIHKDGREELYRGAFIRDIDKKTLRKIEGAVGEGEIHNFMGSPGSATYISPKAVLISDVEVDPSHQSQFKMDPPLVESPLKAIQLKE